MTPNDSKGWTYKDHVTDERRAALAAPGSLDALIRHVVADARDIRLRVEPGRGRGLTHCVQPIFTLELPHTGDALFNGPFGYRAQYWASPEQGLAANAALLAALGPKLFGAQDVTAGPELQWLDLCASLSAASAKFWIRESLSLNDPTPDLDIERWVTQAQRGVELAKFGLMAPEISKFEVKGALIDPYGHEVVPADKIRRHYQIHFYGFS